MHIYTLIAAANIHIPRTMLDTEQINSTRYDSITNTRLHNYLIGDVIGKICKAKHLSLFATPLSFTAIWPTISPFPRQAVPLLATNNVTPCTLQFRGTS